MRLAIPTGVAASRACWHRGLSRQGWWSAPAAAPRAVAWSAPWHMIGPDDSDEGAATARLIEQCRQGDLGAFDELVRLYQARIFHYLQRFAANPHDAEDLTQETFVKAFRSLPRFRAAASFGAWLFTIAKRTALNYQRARPPVSDAEAPELSDGATPAQSLEAREEQACLWELTRRLPAAQAEALWLRYGEGFSIAEVARVMRSNPIRVRVLLHRARGQMAQWLEQRAAREQVFGY